MDALELLATRASNGKLREPAPDDATIHAIVRDALRAPDHGLLRPVRLQLVRGAARGQLGRLMRQALGRRSPDATPELLDKEERKPMRAPLVIVVSAHPKPDPKVPELEQLMTAGAVTLGILLGLQARGLAGMWRTGPAAYDASLKAAFGLGEGDHLIGFLYAGTAAAPAPPIERPGLHAHVQDWTEPRA